MNIALTNKSTTATKLAATVGAAMLTVLLPGPVLAAGESGVVNIVQMATSSNLGNFVFIRASASPTTPAACSYHATWHFVLDTSTDWGKTTYVMLMEARATGRHVWLSGTGSCSGDVEILRSLTTYD